MSLNLCSALWKRTRSGAFAQAHLPAFRVDTPHPSSCALQAFVLALQRNSCMTSNWSCGSR